MTLILLHHVCLSRPSSSTEDVSKYHQKNLNYMYPKQAWKTGLSQVSPNSPTIRITISPLQCLASTKLTELNQSVFSSYLAENMAVSIRMLGKVMQLRKIIAVGTHKSWVYVKKWRFLTFKRVAQYSNHRSCSDYRQDKVASNVQPASRVHISAVNVKCRFLERTTSSQFNKVMMCLYFRAIRRVASGQRYDK
jgi:hypothetical protein